MADFVPWLVYAHGGGFGPGAETFGADGADVEAEEFADGEAAEVEADGALLVNAAGSTMNVVQPDGGMPGRQEGL